VSLKTDQTSEDCVLLGFGNDPFVELVRFLHNEMVAGRETVRISDAVPLFGSPATGGGTVIIVDPQAARSMLSTETFLHPSYFAARPTHPALGSGPFSMTGARHDATEAHIMRALAEPDERWLTNAAASAANVVANSMNRWVGLTAFCLAVSRRFFCHLLFGGDGERFDRVLNLTLTLQHKRKLLSRRATVDEPQLVREEIRAVGDQLGQVWNDILADSSGPTAAGLMGRLLIRLQTDPLWNTESIIETASVVLLSSVEPTSILLATCLALIGREAGDFVNQYAADQRTQKHLARCALLETLRLCPPVAFLVRIASEETELCGEQINTGTEVACSPFLLHRHPSLFSRPYVFDALRWINKSAETRRLLAFSAGSHQCPGRGAALTASTSMLQSILEHGTPTIRTLSGPAWRINVAIEPSTETALRLSSPV
jgi:cytochrome P450